MEDKINTLIESYEKTVTRCEKYIRKAEEENQPQYNLGFLQGELETLKSVIDELKKIKK